MERNSSLLAEYPDPPEGTVKTIVDQYGHVLDFVEFHQQPAFLQNPSLKIEVYNGPPPPCPTFSGLEEGESGAFIPEPWAEEVPPGTVPIMRKSKKQLQSPTLNKGPAPVDSSVTTPSSFTPAPPRQPPV